MWVSCPIGCNIVRPKRVWVMVKSMIKVREGDRHSVCSWVFFCKIMRNVKVWTYHRRFCFPSGRKILYEHLHSIHEWNITLPHKEQFLSIPHIHVDTTIANTILKKGTRGSFHHWIKDDIDLATSVLQKPHVQGGFSRTPNVHTQTSVKVAMVSRYLTLVGSSSLEKQKLWFPS